MRAPRGWLIFAALLAGCSLWPDAGKSGAGHYAPPVSGRDCGVETQEGMNEGGRRCLLAAFEAGVPATFVIRATTIEGDPFTRSYVVRGLGEVEIIDDARADRFGGGKIESQRCSRLVPVAEWNRTQVFPDVMPDGVVFVEDGCEPYSA